VAARIDRDGLAQDRRRRTIARATEGPSLMASRPIWQGHLRLSAVTCLVALYTGAARGGERENSPGPIWVG
jgi:hypothetical protein